MGVVYLAEDTRLGRKVAVKILPKEFSADNARKDRLRLEARAAAALSHPAIATVFSLEELDGRLCLVTEYVRGDTLRAELDARAVLARPARSTPASRWRAGWRRRTRPA